MALYAAFAFWSDAGKFAQAVGRIGWGVGAAILALSLVNYALRNWRWRLFLGRLGHAIPVVPGVLNYFSGFALTTTPGKAGEAIRSMQLKERYDIPVTDSLAAFFAERFSDVLALAVLAALAVAALPGGGWVTAGVGAGVIVVLWVAASDARTLAMARLAAGILPARFAAPLEKLAAQIGRLTRGSTLIVGFVISFVAWAAEGYALFLIVNAVGTPMTEIAGIGIYSVSLLAGALFFLPGGLGSTEAFMVLLLTRAGMDSAAAGAATVVSRVTTLWFAVILGWIAWAVWRRQQSKLFLRDCR